MKKIFSLIAVAIMAIASANATPYEYSLGLATGLQYGPSLKVNFSDNFTLINDLTWFFNPRTVAGNGGGSFDIAYDGFQDNVNLAYQMKLTSGRGIDLGLYAGGGLSLGYADLGEATGKFGVNGIVGIELNMNAPLAVTFDFRPGYALLFAQGGQMHAMDWAMTLAVRYTF